MAEKTTLRRGIFAVALIMTIAMMTGTVCAKSLYVIADINAQPNIPIEAYDIQGTNLVYQYTGYIPDRDGGAVGLAIDTDSQYLFVTFEFSGVLDIVDATNMTRVGQITAPGASNLAGIVVDQGKQKVYCVDRGTTKLYVYDWDPSVPSLTLEGGTHKTLSNAYAYGIALDETVGLLYVANNGPIRYYDTTNWVEQGSIPGTHSPVGVAVDATNKYVYSGGMSSSILSKYDMNTATETTITTDNYPIGFAVDPQTSLLYVTYKNYDRLRVFDSDLNSYWTSDYLGNPTGLCVPGKDISYNPLNLNKDDGVGNGCVSPGGTITYTISYDNAGNNNPVNNVNIVDTLPAKAIFVSATGSGTYNSGTHKVTWNLGNLPAGALQQSVQLVVQVDSATSPGTTIHNSATINSDDTPPTTQGEDTDICSYTPVPGAAEFSSIAMALVVLLTTPAFAYLVVKKKG